MSVKVDSAESCALVWHRFILQLGCAFVAILGAAWAVIILVDPYDCGRFIARAVSGVVDVSPRTANASRGRDPVFDSAIFGNSRGQLLEPQRLSRETGLKFVQLTIPGTGHREQLTVLHWFLRHHQRVGALVFVTDPIWCIQDPNPRLRTPFPFWLYGDSDAEYLANSFRTHTFTLVWRQMQLRTGRRARTAQDGYWDYEHDRIFNFHPEIPAQFQPAVLKARAPELPFPAIALLQDALRGVSEDVPVILVMPPSFFTDLPGEGDPRADLIAQCKGALALAAGERRRGAFLDFEFDGEIARDPEYFMDATHYRASLARIMEHRIASSFAH
jgi:hypothetical protein